MGELTPEHRDYLAAHAVDPDLAAALGVRSATTAEDVAGLPEPLSALRNFPALVFPWTSPDGRRVCPQVRPDQPGENAKGERAKYRHPRDTAPVLWPVRPVESPTEVLIVEGSKQCLAAASHAPLDRAVYGITGCRGWMHDGSPIPDLTVVSGLPVVVILDSDAARNLDVYTAGDALAENCALLGASRVTFTRLPGGKTAGLDDVLGKLPDPARAEFMARLIDRAKSKPADAKPKPSKSTEPDPPPEPEDGRVVGLVDQDRREVIRTLTDAMVTAFSGTRLFNHGGVISELNTATMTPVLPGTFKGLIQDAAVTGTQTPKGFAHGWPDPNVMQAVLARAREFAPLDQVSTVPYVRQDGTVVTTPGYDRASRTVLVLGELDGIKVPDSPSRSDIEAARELLMTDWLGDMPFPTEADRANALALVLTPFVRGLVDLVPLAVIDGKQMGVGKGLLAECLAILVTGAPALPHPYNRDDTEHRKVITSAFRAGGELVIFDEAHTLEGGNFARAITASTYTDRLLGRSFIAEFPNRITWVALGNQVQVNGDMIRRVYRIGIYPDADNPEDRPTSAFRHPGQSGMSLKDWTRTHRAELVRAALVLVRAWFDAGRPTPAKETAFGSFEQWEATVGGIIAHAGLSGFLGNLTAWRRDADQDAGHWAVHLGWLAEKFGAEPFTTGAVKAAALADPAGYEQAVPPPDSLADPTRKAFTKALGEAYARINGRAFGDLRVARTHRSHNNTTQWRVCGDSPVPDDSMGEPGEPGEPQSSPTRGENTSLGRARNRATTREDMRVPRGKEGVRGSPGSPGSPNGHRPAPAPATPNGSSSEPCPNKDDPGHEPDWCEYIEWHRAAARKGALR